MDHQLSKLTAFALTLAFLLAFLAAGCGDELLFEPSDSGLMDPSVTSARSLVPNAGPMHNLILEKTLSALPGEGVSRQQLRLALRTAARAAFAERGMTLGSSLADLPSTATPLAGRQLDQQLDELLDDAHLDLLESRFQALKTLLTSSNAPEARELEALFRSWGIDSSTAHHAALFALLALNSEAPDSLSEEATSLRVLSASSPTLRMVYEIYRFSARFWQNAPAQFSRPMQNSSKEEKLETTMTIVMDAEGGLGGLLFGPIGAILGSAVYSIFWVATGP